MSKPWLELGRVTCPSGRLMVVDPTTLKQRETTSACVIGDLSPGDEHRVIARRCAERDDRIETVRVVLSGAAVVETRPAGIVVSPAAILAVVDVDAADTWIGDRSLDGLADYVIWGDGAAEIARRLSVPALGDGSYGWRDEPEALVVDHAMPVEAARQRANFRSEYRPHSHEYALLRRMWELQRGCGTLSLGDSQLCGFFTSWGPGACPVMSEHSTDGEMVGIRIPLEPA